MLSCREICMQSPARIGCLVLRTAVPKVRIEHADGAGRGDNQFLLRVRRKRIDAVLLRIAGQSMRAGYDAG